MERSFIGRGVLTTLPFVGPLCRSVGSLSTDQPRHTESSTPIDELYSFTENSETGLGSMPDSVILLSGFRQILKIGIPALAGLANY